MVTPCLQQQWKVFPPGQSCIQVSLITAEISRRLFQIYSYTMRRKAGGGGRLEARNGVRVQLRRP